MPPACSFGAHVFLRSLTSNWWFNASCASSLSTVARSFDSCPNPRTPGDRHTIVCKTWSFKTPPQNKIPHHTTTQPTVKTRWRWHSVLYCLVLYCIVLTYFKCWKISEESATRTDGTSRHLEPKLTLYPASRGYPHGINKNTVISSPPPKNGRFS